MKSRSAQRMMGKGQKVTGTSPTSWVGWARLSSLPHLGLPGRERESQSAGRRVTKPEKGSSCGKMPKIGEGYILLSSLNLSEVGKFLNLKLRSTK